jgi:hypothetical protein
MISDSAAPRIRANPLLRDDCAGGDIEEYNIDTASFLLFDELVHDKYEAETTSGLKAVGTNGSGYIRIVDMGG